MCNFGINYLFAWRICYLLEHHTNKADMTALRYILFVYSREFYAVWSSIRTQYSKCCWMNIAAVTSSSSWVIYRRVLNVSCMRLCCLICLCSGVCHSGTVFMFSSKGIFQSLCWLLIGLKCNECVTLMTQIQLIVIFMSYENNFFSTGLYGAEVYVCMCEGERTCGCRKQRLMTVYSSSSVYPFVFLKRGYSFCSLMSRSGCPPFPMPLIWKGVHLNLQTSIVG